MVVRLVRGGLQSYDPKKVVDPFKKKKKEETKDIEETPKIEGITPKKPKPTDIKPKIVKGKPVKFGVGGIEMTSEEYDTARAIIEGVTSIPKEKITPAIEAFIKTSPLAARIRGKKEREAGEEFLGEKEFEEEPFPERVELDIAREGALAETPVLGPASLAIGRAYANAVAKRLGLSDEEKAKLLKDEPLLQDPVTARELAMYEAQLKVINEGISTSEQFGTFVESIPFFGSLAGKYAGGLLETPSENVNTAVGEIKDLRGSVLKLYEAVRSSLVDPRIAFEAIEEKEIRLAELEQRIKLLSLTSPELIADAEAINLIESKILRAKEVVYFAKQAAADAMIGQGISPADDIQLINMLQEGELGEEE